MTVLSLDAFSITGRTDTCQGTVVFQFALIPKAQNLSLHTSIGLLVKCNERLASVQPSSTGDETRVSLR